MDDALAAELRMMAERDQLVRSGPEADGGGEVRLTVEARMDAARVDIGNADRLAEIIRRHGWPGVSLVGDQGAQDAWLLAQHADRRLDLQRDAMRLLEQAVAAGEATRSQLAH